MAGSAQYGKVKREGARCHSAPEGSSQFPQGSENPVGNVPMVMVPERLLQARVTDKFAAARKRQEARRMLAGAVCAGVLVRPAYCSECGQGETQIQAHHDDYNEPLKVRWLCGKCHAAADRAKRLRDGYSRPSDDLALFLLVTGEYNLPHRFDPEPDPGGDGDFVNRAIRSIRFAGFRIPKNNSKKPRPVAELVLSCGHCEIVFVGELLALPSCYFCAECTDAEVTRCLRRRARRA
jgi:ribosomal protein S27AE